MQTQHAEALLQPRKSLFSVFLEFGLDYMQQEEGCGAIDSLLETSTEEFSGNWCGCTTGRSLSQQMSLLEFEHVC